jgi:type IV pilus assembly protein PilY1
MNHVSDNKIFSRRLLCCLLAANLALPTSSMAGSVTLANAPMANATVNAEVLPNLMLIFDDSGSMSWRYLPDWIGGDFDIDAIGKDTSAYQKKSNVYNNIFYDPATTYTQPAMFNADGSEDITKYPSWNGGSSATGADTSAALPNWKKVKSDAFGKMSSNVDDLSTNLVRRSVYVVEAGEFCSDHALKTCQSTYSSTFKYPAQLRWCDTSTNAKAASPAAGKCQGVRATGFTNARYPKPRESNFTLSSVSTGDKVTSIKVGTMEILSGQVVAASGSESAMATLIVDKINACNGVATGNCTVAGFAAFQDSGTPEKVIISAGKGTLATPVITQVGISATPTSFSTNDYPGYNLLRIITPGATAAFPYPGLYPGASTVAKAPTRTDCAGSLCTGNEEMTNFANWYTYYQTRNQMMKTAVSLAFKGVDARYRLGLTRQASTATSDSAGAFLHLDKYELAHKNKLLTMLFGIGASGGTPTRTALAKVGRIYAKKPTGATDPMQYACQKNYAFIATDGYWNGGTGVDLAGTDIGNMDARATTPVLEKKEGDVANSNSLADIAKYYYETDLRTSALGNCTGAAASGLPSGGDVCNDDWGIQRMTTFGLALGIAGVLDYTSDYRTATSGDYYELKTTGNVKWPDPKVDSTSDQPARIDDLWHAAVSSDGIYFSAKSPTEVVKSLKDALGQIDKKVGSGAAAATSALTPTGGDNFTFFASYTTVLWTGNLEARTINTITGETSLDASWCVENIVQDTCASPKTIVPVSSGGSTVYKCVPASGVLADGVEMATSCTGTLQSKVSASADTRTIYMSSGTGLQDFTYSNLLARGLNTNFEGNFLRNNLSQRSILTSDQMAALSATKLVGYLRGQYGDDMRTTNEINRQLFRLRGAALGDIVESQPAYIAKPVFSYRDAGYDDFKVAQDGRAGTVYVGANDGMLHAFDGATGVERWAFVPTPVIPNMWQLANDTYSTNHRNYVNGSPVIADFYDGAWKTILVGGLNGGGRGYYAIDITNPIAPVLLWEFTAANDQDLGFSFGNPVVTKKSDGTWVVMFTSGYNNGTGSGAYTVSPVTEIANSPAGNGKGYLYVLNAKTGALISKIGTGEGSAVTPSGFAKISAWADEPTKNNTASYVYGGDLLGNLWRINLSDNSVFKLANLNAGGSGQAITTSPELGVVSGSRVVYVGTGKYLEQTDLSTTQQQTIYGIMDNNAVTTLTNPRGTLVAQPLEISGTSRATVTPVQPVDFTEKSGWYVDFPSVGERQAVNTILESGTLLSATLVPIPTVCSPGGYSWYDCFDYKTGVKRSCSVTGGPDKVDSIIVGMNVVNINKNPASPGVTKPVVSIVTSSGKILPPKEPTTAATQGFQRKKVVWRELIQ